MNRKRPHAAPLRVLLAGALAVALARCGVDDLTGSGVNPDDVAFSLEGDSVVVLGDGLDIRPVLPKRRSAGPFRVAWTSADPAIASVDSTGFVHGLRVGRAAIEARLGAPELTEEIVRSLSVRVAYASLAVVAPDSLTGLGATRTLVARGLDAGGAADTVVPASFATQDTDVVTVSAQGVVTARGDGTATVTATYEGMQAPVTVRVRRVASRIALASSQLLLTALERDTTVAVIVRDTEDSIMAAPALSWESSDPTAVTVTPEGVIRALRSAPATLTVTSDTVSAELLVLVGQDAASLSISAGNNQQAEVGTPLPVAPAVIARDAGGSPLADVVVVFSVAAGGGTIDDSVQVTDASGVARLGSWTLGTVAGVNALSAEAGTHSLAFTASGVPGPAAASESFVTVSDDVVVANQAITVTLHGRDQYGNDVTAGGGAVTFSASGGTSSGVLGTVIDQGDGDYTATFTGVVAGSATFIGATVDGDAVATAAPSVTVVPGAASQIGVVTGDGQIATVATAVGVRPEVVVRDALNNPVPGATVTFAVTDGGGGVTGSSVATNGAGRAAVGSWTLGTIAGANELTASGGGGISTTFDATGVPGPASATTSTVGLSVTTLTAGDVATVTLVTRDQYGNLRTSGGHTVAFTISGGGSGGTFGPVTDQGDGTYTATFTGFTAGSPSSVGATIDAVGLSTTLPTIEVTPAAPAAISIAGGDGQTAPVATAVPVAPTVRVDDAYGNAVPGVAVTFAVDLGGGQVTGGATLTDASGEASPASWQLGTIVGNNTLDATAGALAVEFSATATPGPASTATSEVTAAPGSVPSLGTSTITLRVRDQYGNDLTTGGLAVTFTASQGTMGSATDNGDGTYTATFTAPVVPLFPIDVTISGFIAGAQVTDTATVTVTLL